MELNRPFNLNLLRSLLVLLETRNLTLAAGQLGTTQSALSKQLAQLRQQFDDPLLIREGHQYLLSERAQSLLEPLRATLAGMDSMWDRPQFDPATCNRQFSMCGTDYIADHMLPQLVRRLAQLAPEARLQFRMWESGHYRLLAEDGVDVVPTIADAVPANLHGRAMGEDRAVCVMRAAHPLARAPLTPAAYAQARHVQIGGGGDKNTPVDAALVQLNLQRVTHLSVPFYATALRLALEHDLLLTVPIHIAATFARQAGVVWQELPFAVPSFRYWLLWHARSQHDPAHYWFRQQVHAVLHASIHGVTQYKPA